MIPIILEALGIILVAAVAVLCVILHIRLGRFRKALADAGQILPTLDASVGRMTEVSGGIARQVQSDMQTLEDRVAAARRLGTALAAANRAAEEATTQLERLLRQHRRLNLARSESMPREMVEPKGFAERAGLTPAVAPERSETPAQPDRRALREAQLAARPPVGELP